jgi:elongation factor 1 alpha-like protein
VKPRLSMVILGHVDAGKSTMMGQVLVQLSKINQRTVMKYQKQAAEIGKASFALAWIMDEDESERERGVTMDVATKTISTPKYDVTILDAPGHKDFVPEMISGAASADVGLLVVAATTGEFESGFDQRGQTREHILLSRGLGVSQLLVAVNKLDAAETPWDRERFKQIKRTLEPFLINCGYKAERIRFVPVSGLTGENVLHRKEKALDSWYNKDNMKLNGGAPTLMEALDLFQPPQRNINKPLRFITSDAYPEGKGVTVRGRVVQGYVRTGDSISVMPIGDVATVNRIEHGDLLDSNINATSAKLAQAGDAVELGISGIDIARLTRGSVLCHTKNRVPIMRKLNAKLLVMEKLDVPIIKGAQVTFHMQSVDVPAVVSKLIEVTRRGTGVGSNNDAAVKRFSSVSVVAGMEGKKMRPRIITGGSTALVGITLNESLCLEEFSQCRALGRFVLRRKGDTIAVGLIEELLK